MRTCVLFAGALALVAALAGPAAALTPAAGHCGQTLTPSVTLQADLVDCPGAGLVFGADGITVDRAIAAAVLDASEYARSLP